MSKDKPFNGFTYNYLKYYIEQGNCIVGETEVDKNEPFIFKHTLFNVKKEKDLEDLKHVEETMQNAAFIETVISSLGDTYENKELFKVLIIHENFRKFGGTKANNCSWHRNEKFTL